MLLALAAGCNGEAGGPPGEGKPSGAITPAYGDTRIEASIGNVSSLIPNVTSDAASHEVGDFMYNGLVTLGRDLEVTGDLAKSWTFSKDCLTLDFKLEQGVRWHDGQPFTADDVVFTWETTMNAKTPSPYKSDFLDVDRVEARGPHEVRISYKRPYAKALLSWAVPMLPRHLLERWVRDGKLREAPQNWTAPIGTGPYRFKEMKSGEKVVVVANPDYFKGRPPISRIVYRIIPSQATIFLELKAKGVDVAALTALQYKRQTEYPAFEKAYNKYRYAGAGYTYFGFNLKDKRFADRRVRRAFAHAINKQELLDGVVLGLGRRATGPFRPGTWADNPEVKGVPYDPKRAQALLAEAGWRERNADGLLVKDGVPFTFELLTNQGNDERKKIAEIIQASLREVGVGVDIRVLEWAALLKEHIKKRNFDSIVLGWGTGADPDQYVVWHSSQSGPDDLNHISYANPEVDALLEAGRSSCVQAERVRYYHRLHQVLADDQPLVFLYWRDALPVVSSRIYGIQPGPAGIKWNFNDWFVPKYLQRYTAG
ncbi:MAG: peptide-binding protein [Candidatus Rokuibacteriota bacterium]|nr:MAG: peptide-binding protein [Candidatus Rokubacteria bacterium]